MKLFTISDMGVKTGFARVMESIVARFPEDWEIHSLGINYRGDPYESRAKIYPAINGGDLYGIGRLRKLLDALRPDRIFILQDSWIIKEYLKLMTPEEMAITTLYTPVDAGPYIPEWLEDFDKCANIVAYTEFGKSVLLDANPKLNVKIIPHGIDTNTFYPASQDEAREFLGKMDPNLYVILNNNRNQPRKRIDLALTGFALFARDKEDVRYYHHAGIEDSGWNILELGKRLGIANKIILTSKNISPNHAVTDAVMNTIYNAADVGLNTSVGEGWGLCMTGETPILTETGYRPIRNIHRGDYVYTAAGRLRRVTNVNTREYSGNLCVVRVSGSGIPLRFTPEHPLLLERGYVQANHVDRNDMWFKPNLEEPTTLTKIDLSHYIPAACHDDNYMYYENTFFGEKLTKEQVAFVRKQLNRYNVSSVRAFKRWLPLDETTGRAFCIISGTQEKYRKEKKYHVLSDYVPPLRQYRKSLADLVSTQSIYMFAPKNFLVSFVKTMIELRGFVDNKHKSWIVSIKNRKNRNCLAATLTRLHIRYGIGIRQTSSKVTFSFDKNDLAKYFTFDKGEVVIGSSSSTRPALDGAYFKVLEKTTEDFSGTVYNLEVDEDHTFLVDGYAVHNCNMEHAITGKPQILPNHSALSELYRDGRGVLLGVDHYDVSPGILTSGAVTTPATVAKGLEYLYNNREEALEIGKRSREFFLQKQFTWESVASKFKEIIENEPYTMAE